MTSQHLSTLPIRSVSPAPVDERRLLDRLRWTLVALATFLLFVPATVLFVLTLLAVVLGPLGVGFLLAHLVVPATERLAALHRRISGALLGAEIPADYAAMTGRGFLARPLVWLRDGHRWRDVGFLAFSMTGGAVLSALPPLLLATPVVHLGGWALQRTAVWAVLAGIGLLCPLLWWLITPAVVRARALAERAIVGHGRLDRLERRVAEVASTRSETLDHHAAEVRRIERDLHDGAQARIVAVGMNVGLAEKLVATDPRAAEELLREARETTVSALEDLRSVVRGIRPPALADRGLDGGLEALAAAIPLPVTFAGTTGPVPAPVESAAYFAVAECLTNTVKHAQATRAWVGVHHDGAVLHLEVGDDGHGGADPAGSGLTGVAHRLAAFDGTLTLTSPPGGPTVVTMEVPCPTTQP